MNSGKRGEDKRADGALPSETSYASAEERRAKDRSGQEFAVLHLACPEGLEPPTPSLEGWCSIQLSYGQIGR